MSEIDNLLNELRKMKSDGGSKIQNSKEIWSFIGQGDWSGAGFSSEEEMKSFVLANPYGNLM